MDLDYIHERISNLSDKQLLEEGVNRISDYVEEVQELYKNEIKKRHISEDMFEEILQSKNEPTPAPVVIQKDENSFVSKIKNIPDSEILEQFFKKNNIEEYIDKFKQEKVFSSELIKELTDSDLEKLGISTLGDRKKVLKLFQSPELDNFKNNILYQDLTDSEKTKLLIKENEIIKQNECKFKFDDSGNELGTLTLYVNRIEWKGNNNHFVIAINKIIDVSVKSTAANSTLTIKAYNHEYNFTIHNSSVATNAALASLAGMSEVAVVGVAMMSDKPITDIEFWRQKIDYLRDYNKQYPNNFGIPEGEPDIKGMNSGCSFIIFLGIAAIIIFVVCKILNG